MEAMGILGFVFGLIAFVRVEKLTKTLKKKRNPRRELQRRVMHPKNPLNHGGVVLLRLTNIGRKMQPYVKSLIRSIIVNAIMWGLIFWFFFEFIL